MRWASAALLFFSTGTGGAFGQARGSRDPVNARPIPLRVESSLPSLFPSTTHLNYVLSTAWDHLQQWKPSWAEGWRRWDGFEDFSHSNAPSSSQPTASPPTFDATPSPVFAAAPSAPSTAPPSTTRSGVELSNDTARASASKILSSLPPSDAPLGTVAHAELPSGCSRRCHTRSEVWALGQLAPAELLRHVPLLIESLEDADAYVRHSALLSISKLHSAELEAELEAELKRDSLAKALVQRLHDSDSSVRYAAVEAVSLLDAETLVQLALGGLLECLGHSSLGVRYAAVGVLGKVEALLVRTLESPDAQVRGAAILSLRQLEPALVRRLGDTDPGVRDAAVVALGQIEPALFQRLQDSDAAVRNAAADGLSELEPEALAKQLPDALVHTERLQVFKDDVREAANLALRELDPAEMEQQTQRLEHFNSYEVRFFVKNDE